MTDAGVVPGQRPDRAAARGPCPSGCAESAMWKSALSGYAASARVSSSGPRILLGSATPDDMLVIRSCQRTRRIAARASRKLGVALRVYLGRIRQVSGAAEGGRV